MTPSWGLLLTTCILMAAPAKEEDPAAQAQATLQRVSKLPLEHQRVWLRLIEQRYGWAVLLSLKPEDAQREQDRVAKILHQKTVGWNELIGLLQQLDKREKAAIGRLVRQYRSDVYEAFRKRARDMVDRQEAWYRIWSLWEKAGSPPEQQDRLMDWLAGAIKASAKDSIGPLPPDPKFGGGEQLVPEQLVQQLTQPPAAKPPAVEPPSSKPPPSKPPASNPEVTKPTAPRQPADDFLPGPELQARAPLPSRVPDPRRAIDPAKQPAEEVVVRRAGPFVPLPLLAGAPPAVVPLLHVFPSVSAATEAEPPGEPPSRYDVVAQLPHQLAMFDVPQPERPAEYRVERPSLEPDPATVRTQSPLPPATQADQHAQVNIEELGTRIEGINLSLRNLEAELNEKRDFTVDQLDSLLSRLDILVLRQKDLTLFRDLVPRQEQAKLAQIDSSRSIVATMGTRIAELRTRIRESEKMPEAERTAGLKHLDELSDRLATLTAEK